MKMFGGYSGEGRDAKTGSAVNIGANRADKKYEASFKRRESGRVAVLPVRFVHSFIPNAL